jgi:hypothetical protein
MKRELLDELVRGISLLAGSRELIMLGSQTIYAATSEVPTEVLLSRECDLLLDESDPLTEIIDARFGPESSHAADSFVYVDTVSSTFPFLPAGWEQRLVSLDPDMPRIRCLEIHDLILSKLAAGRLKDYELIAVLLDRRLADLETVRDRILRVEDLHMRAILLARLQIVLESAGR